jgi:inner membrane protein
MAVMLWPRCRRAPPPKWATGRRAARRIDDSTPLRPTDGTARALLAHHVPLLLAFLCAAAIVLIDDMFFTFSLPQRFTAPLDEVGHAATMVLVLCTLTRQMPRAFVVGSLLGATMLDLDHLSIVFHLHAWVPPHGRPYSHSLAIVAVVGLLTGPARRWHVFGIGVACGLLAHLFRDLATGVAPLFWPVSTLQLSIPHSLYEAAIIGVLGWTVVYRPGEVGPVGR